MVRPLVQQVNTRCRVFELAVHGEQACRAAVAKPDLSGAKVGGEIAMEERQPASRASLYRSWPRYEAADKGFRNYWYPVIESRNLGKKPVAVKVVGESVVL